MVDRQLRRRGIDDERVLAAMREVPRELFLPPDARRHAYRDGAVAIDEGQTMSQPWIVACMTSLLGLRGAERVLEVGTGSGYGAAVLSRCCAEVVTIERHTALASQAAAVLVELGYSNVEVRTGDGTLGAPDRAPFGGALVTAVAERRPRWGRSFRLVRRSSARCATARGSTSPCSGATVRSASCRSGSCRW
jgi:protein-L-isoaspartate(D-aspartate) O-methyltransferase